MKQIIHEIKEAARKILPALKEAMFYITLVRNLDTLIGWVRHFLEWLA